MKIEIASLEDAQELVEIYRYYVEKTAITFEYEVPSVEEFKQRRLLGYYFLCVGRFMGGFLQWLYN